MTQTETNSPAPDAKPPFVIPNLIGEANPIPDDPAPRVPSKAKPEAVALIEPIDTGINAEPNGNDATPIARFGPLSIVIVSTGGTSSKTNWNSVRLPKDAQILDVVEVYCASESTGTVLVFPNRDEAIGSRSKSTDADTKHVAVSVGADKGVAFRKVSPSQWVVKP